MMAGWIGRLVENFYRFAAIGYVPRELFERRCPSPADLPGRTGPLHIEIVSHCWNYSRLLKFQLSSLLLSPPRETQVTMTVVYSPEDQGTDDLLSFFGRQAVPNVTWNWVPIDKRSVFRRAIGRNLRAKQTTADWIFFTDCDQMFCRDSLDTLGRELQGRRDLLVFPRVTHCSDRISDPAEIVVDTPDADSPHIVSADLNRFQPILNHKAIGPLQIFHGDVARQVGYCEAIPFYQRPVERWQKTYEDRVVRWLVGTHGVPIDVPHIYRIEHHHKGRYESRKTPAWMNAILSNAGRTDLMAKFRRRAADEAGSAAAVSGPTATPGDIPKPDASTPGRSSSTGLEPLPHRRAG